MRTIFYDYQVGGPHGAIIDEKYPGVGVVSSIDPVLPTGHGTVDSFTETRGDGPSSDHRLYSPGALHWQ